MVLVTNEVASGDFGAFTARLAPASALQCFCRHAFYFTAKHSKSAEGLTAKARRREGEGNQEREAWKSKYAKGFLSLRLIRLSGSFASLASRPRSASAFFAWLASLAGMKFGRPPSRPQRGPQGVVGRDSPAPSSGARLLSPRTGALRLVAARPRCVLCVLCGSFVFPSAFANLEVVGRGLRVCWLDVLDFHLTAKNAKSAERERTAKRFCLVLRGWRIWRV